jgi:hypothetical protein
MSKILIACCILLLAACNSGSEKAPDTSTDLQCANAFIRSLYEGDFDRAETLMVPDSAGLKYLQQSKFNYKQGISDKQKMQYKEASVVLLDREVVDSQTTIIKYSDPVIKQTMPPIKVVKKAGGWRVDYAYSFSGNL